MLERSTDLSTELYNEWINIDEEVQTTKLVDEEEICGEMQSKWPKENVAGDSDELTERNQLKKNYHLLNKC